MVESKTTHRASLGERAISSTEQLICGPGAVASAAAAEGLALAGARAARYLGSEHDQPSVAAGASAPWVLHRTTAERARGAAFGAFELVAATAQEAVDHCLVAHLTSLAGECLVDAAFRQRLVTYRPLDASVVEPTLLEAEAREHAPADQSALAVEVGTALSRAAKITGRPVETVVAHETNDADVVIVALGDARFAAQKLASTLRRSKVSCGVLGITLLRPFPSKDLAAFLVGKKAILVAEPDWTEGRLAAGVELALRAAAGTSRPKVHLLDLHAANALATAAKLLGVEAAPSAEAEPARLVVGAVPGGPRADSLLMDFAARLASVAELALWRPVVARGAAALALGPERPNTDGSGLLEVVFAAHPVLLDAALLSDGVAEGARVVIAAPGQKPEAVWGELSALQRELCARKKLHLYAFDAGPAAKREAEAPAAPWDALSRALLGAASAELSKRFALDAKALDALVGPASIAEVDSRVAPAGKPSGLGASVERPVMPKAPEEEGNSAWRTALRRFHVAGEGAAGASALLPLAPLAVSALVPSLSAGIGYPLVLDEKRDPMVVPFADVLAQALEQLKQGGAPTAMVSEHAARLVAAFGQELDQSHGLEPFGPTMERALARFAREFALSDVARKELDEELKGLAGALPKTGRLLGLGPHTHVVLHAAIVLAERRRSTAKLVEEIESLVRQLSEVLRLEASRKADSSGQLGDLGGFIDASVLDKTAPKRGPRELGAERKARLERIVGTLKGYLGSVASATELVVVHPGIIPDGLALGRTQRVRHDDGFGVAAGLFDGMARRMAEVVGAARAARAELEGRVDAAGELAPVQLDWQGFTTDELLAIPPVVVVETAERVWRASLDSLSALLRSGRPIHILVEESSSVAGAPPGLGYVLVAHHEAFVTQSSVARPAHLCVGLARMASALRPAVAVVAPRPPVGPMPAWLELVAAPEGRATPCFRYDPDAGSSFADCFDITENPQPDQAWPEHALEITGATGAAQKLEVRFTYADAVALGLSFREHFWVIPVEAWNDEQVELDRYVDSLGVELPRQVPFIWTVGEDGTLARAVVSRKLAFECRERLRVWRVVQELGGSDNEHARRAAEAAREAVRAQVEVEKQALVEAHTAEIERIKREEATEALGRLARVLMDPGALVAAPTSSVARQAAPAQAPAPSAAEAPAPAPEAAKAAPAEEPEEAVSFSEPFVDTPLCTSCNECTNLNPLMFKYNADKQAILADVKAGTFLQLVTAAEKCPAACIHPGAPRKDDSTVTDDLIARAQRFN